MYFASRHKRGKSGCRTSTSVAVVLVVGCVRCNQHDNWMKFLSLLLFDHERSQKQEQDGAESKTTSSGGLQGAYLELKRGDSERQKGRSNDALVQTMLEIQLLYKRVVEGRGCATAWYKLSGLEHFSRKQEVPGSNPGRAIFWNISTDYFTVVTATKPERIDQGENLLQGNFLSEGYEGDFWVGEKAGDEPFPHSHTGPKNYFVDRHAKHSDPPTNIK
ncbi:hypothetical protein B0H14DRAFT_3159066 [Mycena olivaceomarginata]|nr:hypothetical protein B0H14DRAFT_3159066 [Mycena olivaceomarginata]